MQFNCRRNIAPSVALSLVALSATSVAHAGDTLADYSFAANSNTPTSLGPNDTGSTLTFGGGLNAAISSGQLFFHMFQSNTTLTLAEANNSFFQFTITANSGYTFNATGVQITGVDPPGVDDLEVIAGGVDPGPQALPPSSSTLTFNLTGLSNQSAVTYDVYNFWPSGNATSDVTDVSILGTASLSGSTPEPGCLSLIAGIMTVAANILHRRKRRS